MLKINDSLTLYWFGHASFKLVASDKIIYIDPWKVKKDRANLILLTHSHFDHLSLDDIRRIQTDETVIVATKDSLEKLSGNLIEVKADDTAEVGDIRIEVVPAYNIGKSYHPKTSRWVGYIIEVGSKRIYHAGDTDAIPEMKDLEVDVALLPVSGTYTMTAEEAAGIANEFKPKVAIPMHWGGIVGSREDAERFKELFRGETEILEPAA